MENIFETLATIVKPEHCTCNAPTVNNCPTHGYGKEYTPYGEEWEKELMKHSKKSLIALYKNLANYQENYWRQRCEAAEWVLNNSIYEVAGEAYEAWQKLKNQTNIFQAGEPSNEAIWDDVYYYASSQAKDEFIIHQQKHYSIEVKKK